MMSNITFTMLKPDSIINGNTGAILAKIVKSGKKNRKWARRN